ncbi:MAG: DUF1016 domain-containing protein [Symploca sp. SIO2C1]|nr:DUF1016 domain-containing protein [Symploca sp. SIO2C1]
MGDNLLPTGYDNFLQELKEQIRSAQIRAALAVNSELVLLYWQIGREILSQQQQQGWGAKVINQLAKDLKQAFPEMKGFSSRNLKYMRAFAQAYPDEIFVQQLAAQIPWFHNCVLLDKVKDTAERQWYILCKTKNQILVEYALQDVNKPIGVSTYQLQDALPENLQGSLPTIEQLEAELEVVSLSEEE